MKMIVGIIIITCFIPLHYSYCQKNDTNYIQDQLELIQKYLDLKDVHLAKSLLYAIESKINSDVEIKNYETFLKQKVTAHELLFEHDSASIVLEKYADYLRNRVINVQRTDGIANLKQEYKIENKEAQVNLQAENISTRNTLIAYSCAISLLILFGAIWLYLLNRKLFESNVEKAYLIKEIHHRVKNNLQVISSLINLQSKYLRDVSSIKALKTSQNRIETIGLIHKILYQGKTIDKIDIKEFIDQLIETIIDSFGIVDDIKISNKSESILIDANRAILLGLIIDELICNLIEHTPTFSYQQSIIIELKLESEKILFLSILDYFESRETIVPEINAELYLTETVTMLCNKLGGTIDMENSNALKIMFSCNIKLDMI